MGIGLNELLMLFGVVLVVVVAGGLGTGTWLRTRRPPSSPPPGPPQTDHPQLWTHLGKNDTAVTTPVLAPRGQHDEPARHDD